MSLPMLVTSLFVALACAPLASADAHAATASADAVAVAAALAVVGVLLVREGRPASRGRRRSADQTWAPVPARARRGVGIRRR